MSVDADGRERRRGFIRYRRSQAYGMTPGQWARCLALHHARKRLLQTDSARFTVEGIAHELGFRHMGRFAGHYEELFGEYPSATLSRAG